MKKFITNIHQHINLIPLAVNLLIVMLVFLLTGCMGTYYISDTEYSGVGIVDTIIIMVNHITIRGLIITILVHHLTILIQLML